MDTFELVVDPARYVHWSETSGFQPITIRVNGVDLVELVRRIELPFAEAEYDERTAGDQTDRAARDQLAGNYLSLPASLTFLPSQNLLGAPFDHPFTRATDKSLLLQCTCGVPECWFLVARITVDERHVTWSAFEQYHRPSWRYDIAPLVFDRVAYEAQLAPR